MGTVPGLGLGYARFCLGQARLRLCDVTFRLGYDGLGRVRLGRIGLGWVGVGYARLG